MFVSYMSTIDGEIYFGYMVFKHNFPELEEYIKERLFVKNLIIIQQVDLDSEEEHNVLFYNKKIGFKEIEYNHRLLDVEDIGELYTFLYNKYGFSNILRI